MFSSKRRPASTQAVSRKVEGNEPRNQVYRKDDGVKLLAGAGLQYCNSLFNTAISANVDTNGSRRVITFDNPLLYLIRDIGRQSDLEPDA